MTFLGNSISFVATALVWWGFICLIWALLSKQAREYLWRSARLPDAPKVLPAVIIACAATVLMLAFAILAGSGYSRLLRGHGVREAAMLCVPGIQIGLAALAARWSGFSWACIPTALGFTRINKAQVRAGIMGYACFGAAMIVARAVLNAVWSAHGSDPLGPPTYIYLSQQNMGILWVGAVVGVVVVPVAEEAFYRGALFGSLRARLGFVPSALICTAIFALVHPLGNLLVAVGIGWACAWVYNRTGSIWPGIILHAINNLAAVQLV